MMRCHPLLIAAVLSCVPFAGAAADEAYVCEAGKIVYVKPGELEALKKTNACIAGYYGLTIESPPPAAWGAPEVKGAEKAEKGLALERQVLANTKPGTKSAAKPEPKILPLASAATPQPTTVSARPSDFRNVRVLNPAPGAEPVFRHAR